MDEGKARTVGHWLRKARHDLRSAHRLYTDAPPLLDTAAYHCQQAAEKALKGYLTQHDIPFRKTHLLVPLVAECALIDPQFDELAEVVVQTADPAPNPRGGTSAPAPASCRPFGPLERPRVHDHAEGL
jgi:hypothetical protein